MINCILISLPTLGSRFAVAAKHRSRTKEGASMRSLLSQDHLTHHQPYRHGHEQIKYIKLSLQSTYSVSGSTD